MKWNYNWNAKIIFYFLEIFFFLWGHGLYFLCSLKSPWVYYRSGIRDTSICNIQGCSNGRWYTYLSTLGGAQHLQENNKDSVQEYAKKLKVSIQEFENINVSINEAAHFPDYGAIAKESGKGWIFQCSWWLTRDGSGAGGWGSDTCSQVRFSPFSSRERFPLASDTKCTTSFISITPSPKIGSGWPPSTWKGRP